MRRGRASTFFAPVFLLSMSLSGCADDAISVEDCRVRGGEALGLPGAPLSLGNRGADLSSEDDCPGSRDLIGTIRSPDDPNGAICCEVPPSLTDDECRARGGESVGDPGNGSSYQDGCPGGDELIGWLTACDTPGLCGEGGICCGS
jgi:hypothetical protein